ncbi:MAG: hypothetical protein KF744_09835 [Taibaiella sp.]|nr:hypothetical protein [Taibaiella sp.]
MDSVSPVAARPAIFYIKRIVGLILLLALSGTFLFSGWSKIYSDNAFDNFQWTFIDLGIDNVLAAGILARAMIGFEFMLGLFLLGHVYLRKFTYKAIIGVLIAFIIYLLLVIAKQGNTGSCGCFGDKLAMTPLQAIWKNIAMIAATIVLMFIYPVKPYRFQEYVVMLVCLLSFSAPFVMNGIALGTAPVKYSDQIDLNLLYKYEDKPTVDLRQGKHIIAFMSLTCPHCKKAAYLLQIIHRKHPDIPVYMVLSGHPDQKKEFFDETHAEDVPYTLYMHMEEFTQLAGPGVPAIYWFNNGKVEYKSKYAYYQLDPEFMMAWMRK